MIKSNLKKILAGLILGAAVMLLQPMDALAAVEVETNNNPSTATPITSLEEVTGVLDTEDDVDFYKYEVDVTGYYNFTFTNVDAANAEWRVAVYNSDLKELENWCISNENYLATTRTYNFKKGTILYLKISNWRYAKDKDYSLKVNAFSADNWEQESNDTKANATQIISNSEVYGNLYIDNDVDYYQYKVDVTGYYNFTITNVDAANAEWEIAVYNSDLKKLENGRLSNSNYSGTTGTYNFKKGTILYLKISNWSYAVGKPYALKVNAVVSSEWEQEKNDSYSKASALKLNKEKTGNIYTTDDVDYYKFTASKTGTGRLVFKIDTDEVGEGWKITIYDSNKKKIKSVENVVQDKTIKFKVQKGKKYYAVIELYDAFYGYGSYGPVGITYTIKVK